MHRKRIFNRHCMLLLLFCAATLSQQGCLEHRKHFSLSSMRLDYNTFRAPALFFEKREHLPYKAKQVALFHWQYGVTPGKDVRYERPDLWGGDQPYQVPNGNVINVSATEENIQPMVIPNGSMQVGPQMKIKPHRIRNQPGVEYIPPPPGAPPTPGVSSQPLTPLIPPIPAPSKPLAPPTPPPAP
ncbi:MAG: hypothetical protein P1V19_16385 [Gimesia sp.]|nr:hypothetical protein [Gimesia sp.]